MASTKRKPGKKRGNRIRNTLALRPLGVKSNRYEIQARASLLAIKRGIVNMDHMTNLFVLADLSHRIGGEAHIDVHAATIKRLCDQVHDAGYVCDDLTYCALESSAGVLLEFIHAQKNIDIARHALEAVFEIERRAA